MLAIEKETDDLLMTGSIAAMEEFSKLMGRRFEIRKAVIDQEVSFNGCTITKDRVENKALSMEQYIS